MPGVAYKPPGKHSAIPQKKDRCKMTPKEHTITQEKLEKLDFLYEDAEIITPTMRNYRQWGSLVEELRAIRRMVEAGIIVKIEGTETTLTTWQEFYTWAHGRYYLLEDSFTKWIGDDS